MLSEQPPARSRRMPVRALAIGLIVLTGLIAFVISLRVTHLSSGSRTVFGTTAAAAPTPIPAPLTDVARAVLARVVTIEAVRSSDEELGTGWLFDAHGDFVTNAHVISGQLTVRIRDRLAHTHVGRIIGVDAAADIAVIRSADGFAGAPLPVSQGSLGPLPAPVVAVGSGRATGQAELTLETLTQAGQDVPVDSTDVQPGSGGPTTYHDMLLLEGARIFQGNSGGPVLDGRGGVIGMVTLASKSLPQAFAIPIARVFAELTAFAAKPG